MICSDGQSLSVRISPLSMDETLRISGSTDSCVIQSQFLLCDCEEELQDPQAIQGETTPLPSFQEKRSLIQIIITATSELAPQFSIT